MEHRLRLAKEYARLNQLNRTSDTTAPPFCASPVWSSDRACQPAIRPAVARTCDTVTTPVPLTPQSRIPNEPAVTTGFGAGSSSAAIAPAELGRHRLHRQAVGRAPAVRAAGIALAGLAFYSRSVR